MTDNTNPNDNNLVTDVTRTASDPRSMRVSIDGDGNSKAEYLFTTDHVEASTANVGTYPTGEQFEAEINGHRTAIADLQAKLAEQVFDRAGRPVKFAVEGDRERALLQQRIETHQRTLNWTVQRLAEAHANTERKLAARAEAEANGTATEQSSVQAAAAREQAITTLAEQIVNGKSLGRQAAAEMYDRAAAEELARKLASRR